MVRTIQYEDPNKNGIGKKGLRELKGDENGPTVVPRNESGVVQSAGTVADPMYTQHVDSNGKVEGEVGYVSPLVQATLIDPVTGDPIPAGPVATDVTFHHAANAVGDGTIFECGGEYSKLVIEITTVGADTQEIDFLGSIEGTNYYPLLGAKIGADGTVTTGVKTTAIVSEMWEIDITGRKHVKMDLATLTGEGATVTVTGVVS